VGLILLRVLKSVPLWVWFLVAALGWGGWQRHRATVAVTELAEVREAIIKNALIETTRRLNQQVEVVHEATLKVERIKADAAVADLAGRRLRDRANALVASCGASVAPAGQAAGAPGLVFADVLGRLDEAGRQLASIADERGVAGATCERAYDSLTPLK
jgi:hypothetical protein